MDAARSHYITSLLEAWRGGKSSALNELISLVYPELKRLARRYMRSRECETLQTTALVHEAFIRLVNLNSVRWEDRAHFFAMAAQIMRGILVNAAYARRALKRGGPPRHSAPPVNVDLVPDMGSRRTEEILAVHEALDRLAKMDERRAQVVEMRFFGGLSVDETAEVLKISPQSVMRDWKLAKAWLRREIQGDQGVRSH